VARRGIRVRDVLKEGALRTKLEERLREANAQIRRWAERSASWSR